MAPSCVGCAAGCMYAATSLFHGVLALPPPCPHPPVPGAVTWVGILYGYILTGWGKGLALPRLRPDQ